MNNIFQEKKLIEAVGKRSENLHLTRFIAAIMVIVSHAFFISTGSETGELFRTITNNQITMGEFAVSIFFLCGGFLIAMSVEKNKTVKTFFSARIKRLIPPLFFATTATVIFCGFISSWRPAGYVLSLDTWKYFLNVVFIRVRELPGVFTNNANAVVNGAYWTLPLEFGCYIICFIAYKLSFLKEKRYPFGIPFVIAGSIVAWKLGEMYPVLREVISPVCLFCIGMGYWVYREHITLSLKNFVVSILAFVILFAIGQSQLAMFAAFPYMMMYIWFGMKQCSSKVGNLGNYSYGIYLWGYTVQQTIVHFWPKNTMPPVINMLIAIPISIILGALTYEIVENNSQGIPEWVKKFKCPDVIYVMILVIYSLRHVTWGLDLWDTGYSYSNFQYMSFEHMDTMWLFSTYLANVVGNILTKLPFANTLLGMNVYTALLGAALPIIAYFFCTKTLKMARWVVFAGGLLTLSLYWCPTAVLYNYLTYLLMVICIVLLYYGLTKEKKWLLFVAGICLGANVLTRFSNLPQAVLIVAVWAYGFIEFRENQEKGALQRTINRTLWCLGGYLTGLGGFLGYIHIRYGINEYVQGIMRLFSMTDTVEGYKPQSMLFFLKEQYKMYLPWAIGLARYVLIGMAVWLAIELIKRYVKFVKEHEILQKVLNVIGIIITLAITRYVTELLYWGGLLATNYYTYGSILGPAVVFMIMTLVTVFIRCFQTNVNKEDKLFGIMVAVLLIVNSIGSSNGVYSSFNNLCLAAPYTLWHMYQFIRNVKSNFAWPAKAITVAFLYVFFWQCALFGEYFFFTEAVGAYDLEETVENNEVLAGIEMHPTKAIWLSTISEYVNENELQGKEVILLGNIPAMSYYLQMPPAFNSWPDLASYNISQMRLDMEELQEEMDAGECGAPVVIVESVVLTYTGYDKWDLIQTFMEKNGYECTFNNTKFYVYEQVLAE